MDNQIFRKESLDQISSPEQLNDYLRVTNPAVWLVLTAVILLTTFGRNLLEIGLIVLLVLLFTTVDTYGSFPAAAREAIYNAFNENGIEIPFPQQDVYIKEMP